MPTTHAPVPQSQQQLLALAADPATPPGRLLKLAAVDDDEVFAALAARPDLVPRLARELVLRASARTVGDRLRWPLVEPLLANPALAPAHLLRLVQNLALWVLPVDVEPLVSRVLDHPSCTDRVAVALCAPLPWAPAAMRSRLRPEAPPTVLGRAVAALTQAGHPTAAAATLITCRTGGPVDGVNATRLQALTGSVRQLAADHALPVSSLTRAVVALGRDWSGTAEELAHAALAVSLEHPC